jgi:hypothetical protein
MTRLLGLGVPGQIGMSVGVVDQAQLPLDERLYQQRQAVDGEEGFNWRGVLEEY